MAFEQPARTGQASVTLELLLVVGLNEEMSRRSELKCCQLRYSRLPPNQLQYDNKKGRPHESGGPKRSWGGRTRTCNFRINSPAVCQLTYTPMHYGQRQNTSISRTIVDSVAIEPVTQHPIRN